jgi:hypothetical protein
MYQNVETRKNQEIQSREPIWTPLHKTFSGSVWRREWTSEINDIHTDYVVYIGVKNKHPTPEKFGFKRGSWSIHRRAFRFSELHGALNFAEKHSIYHQEEE